MQPPTWAARAQAAADSVNSGFGHRLARVLPGTWIGSVARPSRRFDRPWDPWHYWWQAHYLDCLVDASRRRLGSDPALRLPGAEPRELGLAEALLRTIRIRNFLRYRNAFYDDMAWLSLAAGRADALAQRVRGRGLGSARTVVRVLGRELASANTPDAGGGLFWNTVRRFKNTPATGPAALFFARTGDRERAQRLVDWLDSTLFDPAQGLYLDGVNLNPDGTTELIGDVWTYNQGPVLGALLELGGAGNLARAEALIVAVDARLTVEVPAHDGATARHPASPPAVVRAGSAGSTGSTGSTMKALRGDGGGDGGLFMGILARYLTAAAAHPGLGARARDTARRLVLDTAEAVWAGAEERIDRHGERSWTFPQRPGQAASDEYPPGRRVELSTQLQAWMLTEFACELKEGPPEPHPRRH